MNTDFYQVFQAWGKRRYILFPTSLVSAKAVSKSHIQAFAGKENLFSLQPLFKFLCVSPCL